MAKIKRKDIDASLREQLALKGASLDHYEDLISDYMALWDVKKDLIKDVRERGVSYKDYSAAGNVMWKNNPSIKELVMVNRQMLSILKELKLSTDEAGGGDEDDL
jgi:hypothetical protein